ncbi:MAG: class I SAM-dependent methyltransferase [Flavobacteriales bacterium]
MMPNCPICDSTAVSAIYKDTLLKCGTCTHVWANMALNEEELRTIYAKNYFKGEEYADYLADKEIIQKNFRKRLKSIQSLNAKPGLNNVLEIGCAYGFFGELIIKNNPQTTYFGVDISQDAVLYAKEKLGLNVSAKNYLDIGSPKNLFSDVFMWDVIEHLPNPEDFIKKVSEETLSGGRVYITTGDIGAWLPQKQKEKWRMIHPPTHLHYFTQKSIGKLLSEHKFEIERITYPPVSRSIRVIFYSLFMLNKNPWRIIKLIYKLIPKKASVSANTKDIMFVVARKKP